MRVTIFAPEAMIDDANDLAMVLGEGPDDARTFRTAGNFDARGNAYSVASTPARATFPAAAGSALSRPSWDVEPYAINMAGARRAQAALAIYDPAAPLQVDPTRILAIIGDDPQAAIALAGADYDEPEIVDPEIVEPD